jgi:phosphodiesterase/alkaline phosphatase D-like protein
MFLFLISGITLMAQSAPTATTGTAAGIGSTGATLNGTVNANGSSTTVTFEYGFDTSYGFTWTADQSPVTGNTNTAVTATLSELLPNTLYHYRVAATNASGTTNGADMTFTTLPSPPLVMTTAATAVTTSGATLNGLVNAMGDSTTVTFEYGTDTSYGTTVTADQSPVASNFVVPVSKAITGLANNATYHFRVVGQNSGGTSYGNDMTFTTGAGAAPTAVTNAATGVGSTTATLNGTVNANNADTIVTFEYGLDTGYGSIAFASQSPVSGSIDTAVSVTINDLLPNTTYHYRVSATNINGTGNGADMTFTTLPLAPTATTNAASAVTTTGATLNGTVNANGDSTVVTFEYGTDTNYGTTVTATQSPVTGSTNTAVSRAIAGLTNGVTYHYRVVAVNAGGTTYGADMTFTAGTTPPTAATNAATGIGSTSATLNGTVNANNSSTTVTFQYGTSTNYDRSVAATPGTVTGSSNTSVNAAVSLLTPNMTYHFRVVAVNAGGTTYGADMTFTTGPGPAVTTGAASAVGTSGATLNGTVNANNDSTTVTFEYGLTTAYGTTVPADQSPVSGTTDTAVSTTLLNLLTPSTIYHYRVVGQNSSGTTYGGDMTFTTSAGDPNAPTATTLIASGVGAAGATLRGSVDSKNQSTTVTFEYGTDTNYGTTVVADQSPVTYDGGAVTVTSTLAGILASDTTYHYRVVAQNAFGTSYGADMTFYTSAPAAPTATTDAASAVGTGNAVLNGTVNANNSNTIVSFEYGETVSYGTTTLADQSPVQGVGDTGVTLGITGLATTTTYHYRVVAQNAYGTVNGTDMTFTTGVTAPTATTDAATAVGATTATVNGTVNANNTTTTVTFEYGLDTNYGNTVTADQGPVTGSTDTAVSNTLNTLAPNITYHYRVVAQNTANTMPIMTAPPSPSSTG